MIRYFTRFCLAGILLVGGGSLLAQDSKGVDLNLYVFGNLGDVDVKEAEKEARQLAAMLQKQQAKEYGILINGDMLARRNNGRVHPEDSLRLHTWLSILTEDDRAQIILLPGDRDWHYSGPKGWNMVRQLEGMVRGWNLPRVIWSIPNGCPGPVVIDLGRTVRLLLVQTQWWNHPFDRPQAVDVACDYITERDIFEEIEDILRASTDKNVLIAGHYPLISMDPSGGRISWKQHLFPLADGKSKAYIPLPVIGSFYAAMRKNVGSPRDIINRRFDPFRKDLLDQIRQNGQVVYLSGHGENLQLIKFEDNYLLNSGSIGRTRFLGHDRKLRYRAREKGLASLQFKNTGDVFARFFHYQEEQGFELDEDVFLFQSACDPTRIEALEDIPYNMTYGFCGEEPFGAGVGFGYYDSTVYVSAGPQYEASGLKKFFLGNHYREAWTTRVPVPYVNLDTTFGGLELRKVGGGFQTKSLRMINPDGDEYAFRSIDKDPSRIVNFDLQQTVVATVLKDHTSTLYPYGALITDTLMDAVGLLHPSPRAYLMPPDARLGPYAGQYAHLLGMLEPFPKGPKDTRSGFAGADNVLSTFELMKRRYNRADDKPDPETFATARMFDFWVGDWDRHEDNWKWAWYEDRNEILPVPRDRDQAFSRWDGFISWIMDRRFVRPEIEHFGKKNPDILGLSYSGRHLDRLLLNEFDREDWMRAAFRVKNAVDSQLVKGAMNRLPPGLAYLDSAYLVSRLLRRLEHLPEYASKLSKILDKKVDIVGDNGDNQFDVTRNQDGSVKVEVSRTEDGTPLYERTFSPKRTKEIRLFGLNGNDGFSLESGGLRVKAPIRIRVISGHGVDTVREASKLKPFAKHTAIYEKEAGSVFRLSRAARFRRPPLIGAYQYDREAYEPNMWYPAPLIAYNRDDLFLFSMGFIYVGKAYGKEPYGNRQVLRLFTATNSGAWGINYKGQFKHIMHKWDLTLGVNLDRPSRYIYFFGLGNNSTKNDSLFTADFYRTRYFSERYTIGLLREFAKRSKFHLTLAYEDNEPQLDNEGVMGREENQTLVGRDRANFIRLKGELDLDFRDNKGLPREGMRLLASETIGFIMNERDRPYGLFRLEGEAYATARGHRPLTLGLRAGGGTSFGPVPFYHLFYLGHGNRLRGFFRNRFTGTGMIFLNSELRWEPFRIRGLTSPLSAGVKVFADVGRVFVREEVSNTLHMGYGFGIFVVPLRESFTLSATLGYSAEQTSFIRFAFGVPFR